MDDIKRAMFGDRKAQERITEKGERQRNQHRHDSQAAKDCREGRIFGGMKKCRS